MTSVPLSRDSASLQKRWLAINFYQLGLDAFRLHHGDSKTPFAVVDGPEQQRQIAFCNASARQCGVKANQALAHSLSLAAQLKHQPRDLALEQQNLQSLAQWAYRYSHQVLMVQGEIHYRGAAFNKRHLKQHKNHRHTRQAALLLEIGASELLFGTELLLQMRKELADYGCSASLGSGSTAFAALSASRCVLSQRGIRADPETASASDICRTASARLIYPHFRFERVQTELSLEHSELGDAALETLQACGITRLGQLLQLPKPELGRRLGALALSQLEQLEPKPSERSFCSADALLVRYEPPVDFQQRIELLAATDSSERLLFIAKRLLDALANTLRSRDACVHTLQFNFTLEKQRGLPEKTTLLCQFSQATRSSEAMLSIVRQRLEHFALPAKALAVELYVPTLLAYRALALDLFDHQRNVLHDWPMLLERLRARLGDAALKTLELHPDHRPEQASRLRALVPRTAAQADPPSSTADFPHTAQALNRYGKRPLWLLEQAQPVCISQYQLSSDAERIECGWWDDHDIRRDYYQAFDRNGTACWLYQDLHNGAWFLQGKAG